MLPVVALLAVSADQPSPAPPPAPAAERETRFRGAPRLGSTDGWSIKPRGRLQYDVGHVERPEGAAGTGFGSGDILRRARFGLEGTMPGGFGFAIDLETAGGNDELADAYLTWKASPRATLTLGQHNNFQALEELTSSRFTSFVERAAFTDAFAFNRRLGLSLTWTQGPLTAQAGAFSGNIQELDEPSGEALRLDGRFVYAPRIGDTQLHFAGSLHWRERSAAAAAALPLRYRQRPLVNFTDLRFVATPSLPVEGETSVGLEAAMIRGPLHAAAEAHWLGADTTTPGLSPTFFGAYVELGWFLTGESRGYKGARWDRTEVSRPIESGRGFGAVQLNLRYDRVDLDSDGIVGGTQDAFQVGLIWMPTDHVRFLFNYSQIAYHNAAIPAAGGDRDYAIDVVAARAQIDF